MAIARLHSPVTASPPEVETSSFRAPGAGENSWSQSVSAHWK